MKKVLGILLVVAGLALFVFGGYLIAVRMFSFRWSMALALAGIVLAAVGFNLLGKNGTTQGNNTPTG